MHDVDLNQIRRDDDMTYREKLMQLAERLQAEGEADLIKDVEETIGLCGEYVFKVNSMEAAFITASLTMDLGEYREYTGQLDADRHHTHESLISNVKMLGRLCNLVGMQPVFKGNVDNRIEVGNFALEVAAELFTTRKR